MRSSNPVFSQLEKHRDDIYVDSKTASYLGITIKTLILFLVAVASAFLTVHLLNTNPEGWAALLIPASVIAFISVWLGTLFVRLSPLFSILYGAAEGVILGSITAIANMIAPGIGLAALIATGVIFGVMLLLYTSRTIRVTSRFRTVMFGTLISILIFSIISALFLQNLLAENFVLMLIISAIYIIVGALMLALDFDRAQSVVEMGADKRHEWVVSLGLMVTIVWIYVELIRFLIIMFARKD